MKKKHLQRTIYDSDREVAYCILLCLNRVTGLFREAYKCDCLTTDGAHCFTFERS